jgi:hypothetical protein
MSRFALKEATLTIRETEVRVRELTQAERIQFINADKYSMPALVASLGTVEPKMTAEQAAEEPAEVIEEIVDKILELSGMRKKKGDAQKEPDAR